MRITIVSADRSDKHGNVWNLGDAFLTDVMIHELQGRGHEPSAVDFGSLRAFGSDQRQHTRGLKGLWTAVRSADAVIVGGGTMLQDDNPDTHVGGLPRLCAVASGAARLTGTPLAFFGVGCDPVDRVIPKLLLQIATRGRPVYVRDTDSLARVRGMLGTPATLAADACLLPAARTMLDEATAGITVSNGTLLAMNRRDEPALTEDLLAEFHDSGSKASLIAMSQGAGSSDIGAHSLALPSAVVHPIPYPLSWEQAARAIASSSRVIASRMHALYLAMLLGRPMIAVGDSAKVKAFADEFHVPRATSLARSAGMQPACAEEGALLSAQARADGRMTDLLRGWTDA